MKLSKPIDLTKLELRVDQSIQCGSQRQLTLLKFDSFQVEWRVIARNPIPTDLHLYSLSFFADMRVSVLDSSQILTKSDEISTYPTRSALPILISTPTYIQSPLIITKAAFLSPRRVSFPTWSDRVEFELSTNLTWTDLWIALVFTINKINNDYGQYNRNNIFPFPNHIYQNSFLLLF